MNAQESTVITSILQQFYNYEKFIKLTLKNITFQGYLIEKQLIDSLKKAIFYEELKPQITENYEFTNVKKKLEGKGKIEKIKPIIQTKFNNANELKIALNNNKSYYIMPREIWVNICKPENKNEEGFKCIFKEDKIFITFKNKEILDFNIKDGILENSNKILKKRKKIVLRLSTAKLNIESRNTEPLINKEKIIYDNINVDSYSCINCKSPIELKAIQFKDDNNQDLVIFNCMEKCGILSVTIKEFLQKIIGNTYLNEACSECGKIQLKEYIKNKNLFIYCYDCKKIICNECKERKNKCEHINCININKLKNKCLIHKNNDLFGYCFDENKNVCNQCITNNSHKGHNISRTKNGECYKTKNYNN